MSAGRTAATPAVERETPTLACALHLEERAARSAGARTALVGMGAPLPLPAGPLLSFGLAGALVGGFEPGALVTATRVVSEAGETLWEGEALEVAGARPVVVVAADRIVDDPDERRRLAERTGASVVDMESGVLAASGRLDGLLRAVSDTPESQLGRVAGAARPDGSTNWRVVALSLLTEPLQTLVTARQVRRAEGALRRGAAELAGARS